MPVICYNLVVNRIPNHTCPVCKKAIYKRPSDLRLGRVYCSRECFLTKFLRKEQPCEYCGAAFIPSRTGQTLCSRSCTASRARGKYKRYGVRVQNSTKRRLLVLKQAFNFETCMVEGCGYSKTFDVHRLVEGKDGGKYEIGNMFAVCPNHHAEIHRRVCRVVKIDDKTLRATYSEAWQSPA